MYVSFSFSHFLFVRDRMEKKREERGGREGKKGNEKMRRGKGRLTFS
jgi:hypothetical protein